MMEILTTISQFGPFATIALSLVIIWQMSEKAKKIDNIADNHLHEVLETLKRIESKMDSIDEKVIIIKTKINRHG